MCPPLAYCKVKEVNKYVRQPENIRLSLEARVRCSRFGSEQCIVLLRLRRAGHLGFSLYGRGEVCEGYEGL